MSEELLDEVEALNSIYGEGTLTRDADAPAPAAAGDSGRGPEGGTDGEESVYVLRLPGGASSLRLGFARAYPATAPPSVLGTEHSSGGVRGAGARDLALFRDVLGRVYEPGVVCLFDAVEEFARMRAEEDEQGKGMGGGDADVAQDDAEEDEEGNGPRRKHRDDDDDDDDDEARLLAAMEPPPWVRSEPITENKSTFVAHVVRVTSPRQARLYLSHLLASDKRIRSATHNISAWRIRGDSNTTTATTTSTSTSTANASNTSSSSSSSKDKGGAAVAYQDCDDDGETAAGSRLLHLMQVMELWDAMVVVTRWYGGVKLGPRRFAVINAAARDGFVRAGMVAEGGKDKDGRKKGR